MYLADKLPDFAAEAVTLDGLQAFIEALPHTIQTQVLYLKTQIGLYPILCLDLLYRLE